MSAVLRCVFLSVCSVPFSSYAQQPAAMTLADAEELLLKKNLAIAAAQHQVEAAAALRQIAGLRPNPVLEFGAEQLPFYSNLSGAVPNFSRTSSDGAANPTYTVQLGQLIERGHKRQYRAEQAGAQLDAAKAQLADVFRLQLLELRQAFTAALLARANLQLAEETDRQYGETERVMTIRLRGGEIAEVDLDRVKAARLPFLQAVIEAKLAYAQAARQIGVLLGTTGEPPELSGSLLDDAAIPALEELKAAALAVRPDLAAARSSQSAAERGVRLAEALRTRDVYASVQLQRTGSEYALGAGVSIPLFWFNNQRGFIAQAAAGEKLAGTQVRQAELQVVNDVERSWQAAQSARQAMNLFSTEALERSRGIRSIIAYSYQRGEADLLELLEAQRSANQILTGWNQARASFMNAVWQLQAAVGRSF